VNSLCGLIHLITKVRDRIEDKPFAIASGKYQEMVDNHFFKAAEEK
jgi:hypothetical protein